MNLSEINRIYFLGIGGIGMSALARYLLLKGKEISGYDKVSSVVTKGLESEGIKLFHELDPRHLEGKEMVIYTPAIPADNVELVQARQMEIPVLKRSEVLGEISSHYKTIAVAGTHGKTTTSSIMSHLLTECGFDCTAFLGGIANNIGSNFRFGNSSLMVVEADEYDRSFLTLNPAIAVITSLDPDHLDIYGSTEEMKLGYRAFATKAIEAGGELIVHHSLKDVDWGGRLTTYGVEEGDLQAVRLHQEGLAICFDVEWEDGHIADIRLRMPGVHNVLNALASIVAALQLGAQPDQIKPGLESFSGIYRRFEIHCHSDALTYVDDYAHHPTEIEAVIRTAKEMLPDRQLLVIFQPHLYSRTRDFYQGFASALSQADALIMMEIYPARELPIAGVDSQLILDQVRPDNKRLVKRENLVATVDEMLQFPAFVLSLGAGDIDQEIGKLSKYALDRSNRIVNKN